MIELDPILQTAQDGDTHQPIINLLASSFVESIPFEGNPFDAVASDETSPDIINMSTGRLAAVIDRGGDIVLFITDSSRTSWEEFVVFTSGTVKQHCLCELSDGTLGIAYITTSSYDLYSMIIDTEGNIITAATLIKAYSTWTASPSVERLANDEIVLVHCYFNGTTYSIVKRTSSDFITWNTETTITPSGLDSAFRIDNTNIRQFENGTIYLLFDYVDDDQNGNELINCYIMQSVDNASSWNVPERATNYTTQGTSGSDPFIAERDGGGIEIAYSESKGVLIMDENTTGWLSISDQTPNLSFDRSTGKLYTKHTNIGLGIKNLIGVTVSDLETWTIDEVYTTSSNPAYDDYFFDNHTHWNLAHDEAPWVVSCTPEVILAINTETNTMKTYVLDHDIEAWGLTANTFTGWPEYSVGQIGLSGAWVDAESGTLWLLAINGWVHHPSLTIGFIDLNEEADGVTGEYSFTILCHDASRGNQDMIGLTGWHVDTGAGFVVIGFETTVSSYTGNILIYSLESGGLLYEFDGSKDTPGMAWHGGSYPIHQDGHIYAGFSYTDLYGNEDRYGLMDIHLSSGSIVYHRPSWGTYDNYYFTRKHLMGDGRILMGCAYGITIFNPADNSWRLYDEESVPGMNIAGHKWYEVAYDPVNKVIMGVAADGYGGGIVAFPEDGEFNQIRYTTGIDPDNTKELVEEYTNSNSAIVIDDSNTLWSVWEKKTSSRQAGYWDQEAAALNLIDYLTNDPVTISWEVDKTTRLSFTLSHGHLFDPLNSLSIIAPFLKKGKRITAQLGETVNGIDYFENQGSFVVKETSVSYSPEQYPSFSVSCEDVRTLWGEGAIIATEYFSDTPPEEVISSLLEEHGRLTVDDISLPTISEAHSLYHQFIDQNLKDIIDGILGHFEYFLYIDHDGLVSAKKIDLIRDADYIFENKIVDLTPDDSYSTFINKIVCSGEGWYEIEVLYDLEAVGKISGTITPYGGTTVKRVWYSDDHVRVCRDPQLEVIVSIQEFEIFLLKKAGSGKEFISNVDPDEKYVDITIEAPDLTHEVLALIAAILATGYRAIGCYNTCGITLFALSIELELLSLCISAFAQYDYVVHAKPLGHEKQTFQAEANDYTLQRELNGMVIEESMEDPYCYTVQECSRVANFELSVVQAQRSRLSFKKTAHLQTEIGDVIEVNHPYTDLPIKVFATALIRTYQTGDSLTDLIEGWKII